MNLDDLRTHLTTQADEVDPATPVPLPAIRRHRTTLKRRRAAAILTTALAAVAVIATVLPGAINTSTPDPAKPPPDYTRDGITIPGAVGPDRLEKAEIAKPGATTLEFSWTPETTSITFRSYCETKAADQIVRVTVDNYLVLDQNCDDTGGSPRHHESLPPDHILWLQLTRGRPAKVRVDVMTARADQEVRSVTGLAVGIYRSPEPPKDPAVAELPIRSPSAEPGDYAKDGFRFPAKVAADPMIRSAIGDLGQQSLTLRFTPRTPTTDLRPFCATEAILVRGLFSMKLRVDGRLEGTVDCTDRRADLAQDRTAHSIRTTPGRIVTVTMQVVENATGKPFIDMPSVHIGVGAYAPAPYRMFQGTAGASGLEEVIEYGGYRYKLADIQTAAAATSQEVSVDIPADKPYVIAYGGNVGAVPVKARVRGLTREFSLDLGELTAGGPGRAGTTYGQPAGPAHKVTLQVVDGRPINGFMYLGLYLPE